jgi:rhodanese-related sulfurtransferase
MQSPGPDSRPTELLALTPLAGAVNVPIEELEGRVGEVRRLCGLGGSSATTAAAEPSGSGAAAAPGSTEGGGDAGGETPSLYVICRRGNASQEAVVALRAAGLGHAVDVIGGMSRWAADVDGSLPVL